MALLWCEGFDNKATYTDLIRAPVSILTSTSYTNSISTTSLLNNRWGGYAYSIVRTGGIVPFFYYKLNLGPLVAKNMSGGTINIGFWMRSNAYNTNANPIRVLSSDGNWLQLDINVLGVLQMRNLQGSIMAIGKTFVYDDQWHWIEAQFTVSTSAGVLKLYVDGILEINYSGATATSITSGSVMQQLWISPNGTTSETAGTGYLTTLHANSTLQIDDIIVWDDQGSAFNTFPIGPSRIYTQVPTSDSSVAYTRSTGASNFSCIDENVTNADVDYVESSTIGNADFYGLPAVSSWAPTSILAQVVKIASLDPSGGGHTARINTKLSGTTVNGTTLSLPVTYAYQMNPFYTKPGGGAWTTTDLGNATIGMEVVS